ncbi:radical S-adenosyl methionine domain-containing protein 1, mitochondrial isoform X2 [Papio anubis]|uniref:radical S-adenosyl methionine domain-containing protein 1, mitochondrial isoform X2 n=1 Tax=Papio anubis TaxID=9555 RepID=UPI0004F200F3|nr:radical S-adenosyl methionine domain-containing protein 1, mitochondrial isoform X2 [Papio anubis]
MGPGTRPGTRCQKAGSPLGRLGKEPTGGRGERPAARQVAPQPWARALSARGHAAPLPSAGSGLTVSPARVSYSGLCPAPRWAPWRSPEPGPAAGRQQPERPRGAAAWRAQEGPRVLSLRAGARRFTYTVESVFFGGGTPSLASPHTVAAVLEAVAQTAHLPADSEVTLEANPTSTPGSRLAEFGAAGVNRLSIGLQSLDNTELRLLGRTHSACDALRTLAEARRLFPGRVSVDFMLGLPAQQVGLWLGQLQELLHHCDDHLSLYQLSLERGTALFAQVQQGVLPAPDPELAAEMYQRGRVVLREAGFRQYEVSNFARNGALSTHNWTYWQCGQYLGIGPGAHGRFMPQGAGSHTREARIQTLEPDNWMKEVMMFGHGTRKRVPLGRLELLEEVLALGLRTDVGITHQHWQQFEPQLTLCDVFGANKEVQELLEQGLLQLDHRCVGGCQAEGAEASQGALTTALHRPRRSEKD